MPLVEIFLVVVRYLRSSITQTTFVEISLCLFQHGPSALHVFRVAMTCRPRLFKVHILSLFRKVPFCKASVVAAHMICQELAIHETPWLENVRYVITGPNLKEELVAALIVCVQAGFDFLNVRPFWLQRPVC